MRQTRGTPARRARARSRPRASRSCRQRYVVRGGSWAWFQKTRWLSTPCASLLLPAEREPGAASWRVVCVGQFIVLVEEILDLRGHVPRLRDVVARGKV